MTYMTSTATNAGTVDITVYFKQGTDPDMAAVNVQNRVSKATGQLPAEVTQVGVTTSKRQTSILQMFSLYSPDDSYDEKFLSNYISINLKPSILRIQGVGDMMIMGGDYSMRIWMKPDVMAQYKLIPSDVTQVLAEQNIESATGSFGENSDETYQYTMKYKGRLITPEEFGEIVIRSSDDGEVLKLKEIADIEKGRRNPSYLIMKTLAKVLHFSLDSLIRPELTPDEAGQNEMKLLYLNCPPEMRETLLSHTRGFAEELKEISKKLEKE